MSDNQNISTKVQKCKYNYYLYRTCEVPGILKYLNLNTSVYIHILHVFNAIKLLLYMQHLFRG